MELGRQNTVKELSSWDEDEGGMTSEKERSIEFNELVDDTVSADAAKASLPYSHHSPKYSPARTASSVDSPAYSPLSFWFASDSLCLTSPSHYSLQEYSDYTTSPNYAPLPPPIYCPETPNYSPTSPSYKPLSPIGYNPTSPSYSPTITCSDSSVGGLAYHLTSPDYSSTFPNYGVTVPVEEFVDDAACEVSKSPHSERISCLKQSLRRRTVARRGVYAIGCVWRPVLHRRGSASSHWLPQLFLKRLTKKSRARCKILSNSTEAGVVLPK